MQTKQRIPFIIIGLMLFSISCDSSSTGTDEPEPEIEINTVEDLDADGKLTLFSLRTGEIVDMADSASTQWDIGFEGTRIYTNSGISGPGNAGAILLDVPFNGVSIAPSDGYETDTEEVLAIPHGGGNGWYTYTGQTGNPPHAILPIPDLTIVLRTADGNHYAKMEMITYYKGNPDISSDEFVNNPTERGGSHYTFRYAIQQTEGFRELN